MNADFRDFGFWCEFLAWTWGRSRRRMVDLILDAGRVRESWAQADLFLAARTSIDPVMPYFYCNIQPRGFGGSVDWSYWSGRGDEADTAADGAVPLMVAELKFLGGNYAPKVFAGHAAAPNQFTANGGEFDVLIGPDHPLLPSPRLGYLLEDYRRLLRYDRPSNPLRMLVLLLDKRHHKTELANCLANVEFERPGRTVVETATWKIKAWEITGRAAVQVIDDRTARRSAGIDGEARDGLPGVGDD